jgi:pSer/pThr/pTyr-binding forkhead associated (FHA) protein
MNDEEIISTVASHLTMPPHFVQVQKDHNNSLHQAQSKNVAAYAKVTGKDWTFYVKRLSTSIGRPPEAYYPPAGDETPTTPLASNEGVDVPAAPTESSRIHIDLGPNKLVSRLHAEIYFDSNTSAWYVLVNGRNGLRIDELIVRRGQKSKLRSGAVIEIGGVEMMFVLPAGDQPVEIHEKYLRRAGLIAPDPFADNANDTMGLEGRDLHRALGKMNQLRALSGQPVLAPAPPDYRKPDTPIKQRSKPVSTQSPALNNSGITMMSSGEVDLSLEQNNHIKPTYTYGQLITQAIMACPNELATLNDIYKFLQKNYSFYRKPELQKGWQVCNVV